MAFSGTVDKIFVRPSALTGTGEVNYDVYPPEVLGGLRMSVEYVAVAVDADGVMVYQLHDEQAGVGLEFQISGYVLFGAEATARTVQEAMTADARQRYGAPDAEVVYITDNRGWI